MARADFELAYGRGVLPLALPAGAEPTVIRKAVLPKLPDKRPRSATPSTIRSRPRRCATWRGDAAAPAS